MEVTVTADRAPIMCRWCPAKLRGGVLAWDSLPSSRHLNPSRPNWVERTFIRADEAEDALCRDRPAFIMRPDIMDLIPRDITRYMGNPEATAYIKGFQELFIYLNQEPRPWRLCALIEAYFNDSPALCGHLSQSSQLFCNDQSCFENFDHVGENSISYCSSYALDDLKGLDDADRVLEYYENLATYPTVNISLYIWISNVIYPRRRCRIDKPPPHSGSCRLCNAVCQSPEILRQHVLSHRREVAFRFVGRSWYRQGLALIFAAAELESTICEDIPIVEEVMMFKECLMADPEDTGHMRLEDYPLLHQKLRGFCTDGSWLGVKWDEGGTKPTPPIPLAQLDHASLRMKPPPAAASSDTSATSPVQPPLRRTVKGLAARFLARGIYRKSTPAIAVSC